MKTDTSPFTFVITNMSSTQCWHSSLVSEVTETLNDGPTFPKLKKDSSDLCLKGHYPDL